MKKIQLAGDQTLDELLTGVLQGQVFDLLNPSF